MKKDKNIIKNILFSINNNNYYKKKCIKTLYNLRNSWQNKKGHQVPSGIKHVNIALQS